ncbi:MAG: ATP-binding protein [Rhodospirillaceae bacterium]|nr:ATP-binding protein [Rhodospirillaceae bacterium]
MIRIEHASDVGMARRLARELADAAGLDEEDVGRAALVTTEVATNLVRHAESGTIFVRRLDDAEGKGVEILAVDRGPGMANVASFMADGVSTRGTPGQGLGALKRMADTCTIDSRPGEGTIVALQVRNGTASRMPMAVGGLTAPIAPDGCGDAFAVDAKGAGGGVIMIDGLGHGADAAAAAERAVECFHVRIQVDLKTLFEDLNRALSQTRGAAIAVAEIQPRDRIVRYMGVGNISGLLISGGRVRNMVSHNGIVGHTMRRLQQFEYPIETDVTVILHTDGIGTRWQAASLAERGLVHPSIIAGHLWRSEARGRDDAGIAVVRGRT